MISQEEAQLAAKFILQTLSQLLGRNSEVQLIPSDGMTLFNIGVEGMKTTAIEIADKECLALLANPMSEATTDFLTKITNSLGATVKDAMKAEEALARFNSVTS